MRWLPTRPAARRGVIVALDGLAIWLLAIVLASYADPGSVDGSSGGLIPTAVDTTVRWATTAGVDAFELIAYGGLVAAALGPLWYLIHHTIVAPRRRDSESGVRVHRRTTGSEADQPGLPTPDGGDPVDDDRRRTDEFEYDHVADEASVSPPWVDDLFEPDPGPSDFLRGGSDRNAGEPEPSATSGDGAHGVRDDRDDEVPGEDVVDPVEDASDTDASRPGVDVELGTADWVEDRDEGRLNRPDEMDGQAEPSEDGLTATEGESTANSVGPAAAVDELGSAVAAARARIDTLSDRISAATAGSDVDTVVGGVTAIDDAADEPLRPLSTLAAADPPPLRQRAAKITAEQRRIESALDAVVRGE